MASPTPRLRPIDIDIDIARVSAGESVGHAAPCHSRAHARRGGGSGDVREKVDVRGSHHRNLWVLGARLRSPRGRTPREKVREKVMHSLAVCMRVDS